MTPEISIVIPVYNEEENIPLLQSRLTEEMEKLGREYEIIYVDDHSLDATPIVLKRIADENPRVRVMRFRRNAGQTAALMAGFDCSCGEVIIPMDGDLQNDPADIPRLLDKLEEGHDVVSGWRRERKDAFRRTLPSRVANRLISSMSGVRLHDYGCTLKAYRRNVLEEVRLYGEMHRFLPIYASWAGARVTEIPVVHHPRKHGVSKYGMERTIKVLLDLIVVKFLDRYSQRPMYVFGGFGLLSILLSVLCFMLMLYFKFFGDKSFIETPLPLLTTMLFLIGIMSFFLGLIAEMLMRTYFEAQNKRTYLVEYTCNFRDS